MWGLLRLLLDLAFDGFKKMQAVGNTISPASLFPGLFLPLPLPTTAL